MRRLLVAGGASLKCVVVVSTISMLLVAANANAGKVLTSGPITCFDDSTSSKPRGKHSEDSLIAACSADPVCAAQADEMFEELVMLILDSAKGRFRIELPGSTATCWVVAADVNAIGLTEAEEAAVVCDPYGGMGAQRCEEAK